MKKVALTLASIAAIATFAPEASALPVFARQVGMACNACHFQHFPLLNGFGRAFKQNGFTMMGTETLVEGDRLSIPSVLNASILTSIGYEKSNALQDPTTAAKVSTGGASTGAAYVGGTGGESSLFVGGRGSENMGYLAEIGLSPSAGVTAIKTPILFDVGGTRVGVVPFTTDGQGASYGFETLNTGANPIHSITNTTGLGGQYIKAVAAAEYLGMDGNATGAALVVANEMGFINVTKFDQGGIAGGNLGDLNSTYIRVAATFDLAGWDAALGVQSYSGSSADATGLAYTAGSATNSTVLVDTKATVIDGQAQGEVGGLPVGIYFSYGKAPANDSTSATVNAFNAGTLDKTSLNISAEVGVVPEVATIGGAIRQAKTGVDDGTGTSETDNALFLTATYKLAQNQLVRFSWVNQTGTYWTQTNSDANGSSSWTVNLYALF